MNNNLLKLLTEGWLHIDNNNKYNLECNHPTLSCVNCPVFEECDNLESIRLIPEEIEYLYTHHPELFI